MTENSLVYLKVWWLCLAPNAILVSPTESIPCFTSKLCNDYFSGKTVFSGVAPTIWTKKTSLWCLWCSGRGRIFQKHSCRCYIFEFCVFVGGNKANVNFILKSQCPVTTRIKNLELAKMAIFIFVVWGTTDIVVRDHFPLWDCSNSKRHTVH